MKNNCNGFFGFLFGHKFESRNDSTPRTPGTIATQMAGSIKHYIEREGCSTDEDENLNNIINGFRYIENNNGVYIQDVCVRCGETIKR